MMQGLKIAVAAFAFEASAIQMWGKVRESLKTNTKKKAEAGYALAAPGEAAPAGFSIVDKPDDEVDGPPCIRKCKKNMKLYHGKNWTCDGACTKGEIKKHTPHYVCIDCNYVLCRACGDNNNFSFKVDDIDDFLGAGPETDFQFPACKPCKAAKSPETDDTKSVDTEKTDDVDDWQREEISLADFGKVDDFDDIFLSSPTTDDADDDFDLRKFLGMPNGDSDEIPTAEPTEVFASAMC